MRLVLEIHVLSVLSLALSGLVRRLDLSFVWDLNLRSVSGISLLFWLRLLKSVVSMSSSDV